MNNEQLPKAVNRPNLGTVTGKIVELFDRALDERDELKKWIAELSSKSNPTIRDRLCLACYRHQLSFREPPLPRGKPLTGANVWEYWANHRAEYREYCRVEDEILSYLEQPETLLRRAKSQKAAMLELFQQDRTILAYYPVIDEMFGELDKKPGRGRPPARRLTAVRALQMEIDNRWKLKRVTQELCDCGKATHDEYCEQQMRQSIDALKRLLRKWDIQPPKP